MESKRKPSRIEFMVAGVRARPKVVSMVLPFEKIKHLVSSKPMRGIAKRPPKTQP